MTIDDGLHQECGERLVQALEGFRFNCLHLEGITDRSAAWPIILEYACQSRLERLSLEPAQDISLAACLRPLRSAAAFIPYLTLKNCVLDGELFSALQSMSVRQLYLKKCSIREGQTRSVARGIASNTSLHQLDIAGKEMDPMLPETLTKGIANNMTLQVLLVFPIPLVPTPVVPLVPEIFPALCRGIGRNCSVRRAELLVSSPMDESVMLELARSKTLLELKISIESEFENFSWSAVAAFVKVNRSVQKLDVKGKAPSDSDLHVMGLSLSDGTSLEELEMSWWYSREPG